MTTINRTRIIFAFYDIMLVAFCILAAAYIHDSRLIIHRDESYLFAFLVFPLLWMVLSLVTRKFRIGERSSQRELFLSILYSNFTIMAVTTIVMVLLQLTFFSRFILFGTVAAITFFEIITGFIYVSIQKSVFLKDWIGLEISEHQVRSIVQAPVPGVFAVPGNFEILRESITQESGKAVNAKLPPGGIYIGCGETYTLRKPLPNMPRDMCMIRTNWEKGENSKMISG